MWLKNAANLINQLSKSEYTTWLTNTSSLNSDVTYTKFDKFSASLMDTEALFRIIVMQEIAPHINNFHSWVQPLTVSSTNRNYERINQDTFNNT